MSNKNPDEAVFSALKHDIRRNILRLLAEKPSTYTEMLEALGIESGHLAYHLRNMGRLIEKDENGVYTLSENGLNAYGYVQGVHPVEIESGEKASQGKHRYIIVIAALLILAVFLTYSLQYHQAQRNESKRLINETMEITEKSLNAVYTIFDGYAADRDTWTQLVMDLLELRNHIDELSTRNLGENFIDEGTQIGLITNEFTEVMKKNDDEFLILTVEKRYLVRDLQSALLSIQQKITKVKI